MAGDGGFVFQAEKYSVVQFWQFYFTAQCAFNIIVILKFGRSGSLFPGPFPPI